MRVLICPDAFKGTLTAPEAAQAMAQGIREALPAADLDLVPMADGGAGTIDALAAAITPHRMVSVRVRGPLGDPVVARYILVEDGRTAVVEMAEAAGLTRVPPERRDPLRTTTYGVGELIRDAIERGAARVVVGVGGSATNDGGMGMAQALGFRFLDEAGAPVLPGREEGYGGAALAHVARIDRSDAHPALARTEVIAATDVRNPLCGPEGAAAVYGPQKGASPDAVRALDAGLRRLARAIGRDLGRAVEDLPGAGAAGGLGAGIVAFLGGRIVSGVEWVVEATGLRARIARADVVVTGEGRVDRQTAFGKTVAGIARHARAAGKPVVVVAGSLGEGWEAVEDLGVARVHDASQGVAREPADLAREAARLLAAAARRAAEEWREQAAATPRRERIRKEEGPMGRVYVTRRLPEEALDLLRAEVEVDLNPEDRPPSRTQLIERVRGKDGLISLLVDRVDAEVMDASPRLEVIANYAVGFDNVDVREATRRGILVTNTPGVLTETTADFAFALMIAIARRIPEADAFTRQGLYRGWSPMLLLGQDVHAKTVGILGLGRIGSALARRCAHGFRMRVLYHDAHRAPDLEKEVGATFCEDPDVIYREADFISVHLPLTETTRHFVGERALSLMKPTACLINTARGPIVDEEALARALRERRIFGAALDVYEHEPEVHPDLRDLPNVILAPHIASASVETRTRMALLAVRNLLDGLAGRRPESLVNPEAWRG